MHIRKLYLAVSVSALIITGAHADILPAEDIQTAIDTVAKDEGFYHDCVKEAGTKVRYSAKKVDVNGDGVPELEVASTPDELKNGSAFCYARSSQDIYLLRQDGRGGWIKELGFDAATFEYHSRGQGKYDDIEMTGPGFCFPIWRFDRGEYRIWKTCKDGNELIFAEDADWIKTGEAAPRDDNPDTGSVATAASDEDGETHVDLKTVDAPEYMHNGSVVLMDFRRGRIIYSEPKASLSGTVRPGDILYRGNPWDISSAYDRMQGTAYVFRKGCKPAPYKVKGGMGHMFWSATLRGDAPVRAKGSCKIIGYKKNGNSKLHFETLVD